MSDPKDTVASAAPTSAETVALGLTESKPEPKAKAEDTEPHWLNARLERERVSMLKKLGFESLEEGQSSAAELKSKREAEKTSADKAAEALNRAKKAESKEKALSEAVTEFAARQMIGLTDEQKAAVTTIAGDDSALQLKAIAALQPTWAAAAANLTPAKAVDTAPPANAPSQTTTSETNHKSQYELLKKSNPFLAAHYALAHAADVYGDGT